MLGIDWLLNASRWFVSISWASCNNNNNNPNGTTILPWSRGRPLAWDVTVSDRPTYADAHVVNTAREAGAAANYTATNENTKYSQLSNTPVFVPVAIETGVLSTIRRWNWYRRLEDGRPTLQAMPGSPPSCSSSCPWHYRGECCLISKHVHRQLARCNPLFHFLNVLVPTGFVLVVRKIIIIISTFYKAQFKQSSNALLLYIFKLA